MTDVPLRFFGPAPLMGQASGSVLYTAPSSVQKVFIRDITFSNFHTSDLRVRCSIGSLADSSKRVIDQVITQSTATFVRPLWLMDAGETFEGAQVLSTGLAPTLAIGVNSQTGTDGTSFASALWNPVANTTYVCVVSSGVASGTTALNPTSVTQTGMTWTLITGSQATSTVAASINGSIAAYWARTGADVSASAATATTANFASTQHSFSIDVFSVAVSDGSVAVPGWTTSAVPYIQAAAAGDSTAPSSTNQTKAVTLGALKTGITTYHHMRVNVAHTSTPQTGFTEILDTSFSDVSGNAASFMHAADYVSTLPWTNTTIGPDTLSGSSTSARCGLAIEWVPTAWVNCMLSGIEVRP